MRRSFLAIGLALLLSFTTIIRPVSAADMPVKAPPPPVEVAPVEICWWCIILVAGIITCIAICHHEENRPPPAVTFPPVKAL